MSKITEHRKQHIEQLYQLFNGILAGNNLTGLVEENKHLIENTIPSDVVYLVDKLMLSGIPVDRLKKGINKLLNLLHRTIHNYPYHKPVKESFLGCLIEDNAQLDKRLKVMKPLIREVNKSSKSKKLLNDLKINLTGLHTFNNHYLIIENVLFPVLEKKWGEFRCVKVMWSFHDDIRRDLKAATRLLENGKFDLKQFNRLIGNLFFNMYAIVFREERILFPLVAETIPEETLNELFYESLEIGFPYYQPEALPERPKYGKESNEVDLQSGVLSPGQIRLLFNHLPVDITFVDENDKVRYFSTPEKRIFPRTKSIIGRDVKNCHPPESIHLVEQIVDAFRKGEKNVASFWIKTKGEYLLIRYIAVRDEHGNYKGVLEVSQEISEIQNISGEKRLLDWDK